MTKGKGAIALVGAKVVNVGLQFLATRLYLQWLGQANYGIVLLFASISAYMNIVDLGYWTGAQRRITLARANNDGEDVRRTVRCLAVLNARVCLLAVVGYVLLYLLFPIPGVVPTDRPILFAAAGVQFIAQWLSLTLTSLLISHERFNRLALTNFIQSVVTVLVGLYAAYTYRTPQAIMIANACSFLAILVWNMTLLRPVYGFIPLVGKLDDEIAKDLSQVGRRSYAHRFVANMAGSTDKLIIGSFFGPAAVTLYGIPARIPEVLKDVFAPIYTTTQPEITRALDQDPKFLVAVVQRNSLLVLAISLAFIMVPCSFGTPLIEALFPGEFPNGGWVCALIGLYKAAELYYSQLAIPPYAKGRPDWLVPFAASTFVISAGLTYVAYQNIGVLGVALVNVGITILQFLPYHLMIQRRILHGQSLGHWYRKAAGIIAIALLASLGGLTISASEPLKAYPWLAVLVMPPTALLAIALMVKLKFCPKPTVVKNLIERMRSAAA
ncbi:MAG: hypothetical protein HONBIEJF_02971 [Fimbriimonadaceae bacterium]|nr:hypothetical protein [Fimbriimonadaceae bacterium]